jgi:hypothetical protein
MNYILSKTSLLFPRLILFFSLLGVGLINSKTWAVDLSQEKVGGAGFTHTFQALTKYLGKPIFSREIYDENSRCWVSIAHFEETKEHKVQVELCRTSRKLKIRSVRALGDSKAQTNHQVGIGSQLTDLIKVYDQIRIVGEECVVVEDSLNALTLRFILENGKVSEINFYLDPTLKEEQIETDFSQIF